MKKKFQRLQFGNTKDFLWCVTCNKPERKCNCPIEPITKNKIECAFCGKLADESEFVFYPDKTREHKKKYCKFVSPI